MPTWDANQYLRFDDERTRPSHDLCARIPLTMPRRVVDLGCGPGNSTAVLAARWPTASIVGLDSSVAMIDAARAKRPAIDWRVGDIAGWADEDGEPYDVIFSNAALQWVPDHATVLPAVWRRVASGGVLAVQVPANPDAPPHVAMRELAQSADWRSRFARSPREWHVQPAAFYYDVLASRGARVDLWLTDYVHVLPNAAAIVEWYRGTGLRPFLDALPSDDDRSRFIADYAARIEALYPPQADGRVLFPFRRLFIVAARE